MSAWALQVDGISKRYRIGTSEAPYDTLRGALLRTANKPVDRLKLLGSGRHSLQCLWALRDVSFELSTGQVLGVIGHNGAGKTTLLKILSRITEPTSGRAQVRGRVGSLLEVGTGFHPELTGRENTFLNGAILGMTRRDILERFDEIVAFAGVEAFVDTPLKYYSTGMHMRLAFAVAAHMEPDVLVVDEVLAVGDAEFQKKCLGTMADVARSGRTVLFVSHNLAAVQGLCERAILLDHGRIAVDGEPSHVIAQYLERTEKGEPTIDLTKAPTRWPQMSPVLRSLTMRDGEGRVSNRIPCGGRFIIEMEYEALKDLIAPNFGAVVMTREGTRLFHLQAADMGGLPGRAPAAGKVVCDIPAVRLLPGTYVLGGLGCRSGVEQLDLIEIAGEFEVIDADVYGTGRLPDPRNGVMLPEATWSLSGSGTPQERR